jgi:hypothetical protein
MNTDYAIIRKNWDGIEIEIRWNPDYLAFEGRPDMAHLEIESIRPARAPLPMTETGYRSHFIQPDEVERFGGPEAYVEAWITELAGTAAWHQTDAASRQLALF